ncbi:hypothetical protein PUN28_011553 [Cardiocondyla obscurior]|uniref:Uncharacterized protein n=1 Tax=Cardiocondyla obscurior TaxID=286306 RepID=A0AAW2FJL9_9HYME
MSHITSSVKKKKKKKICDCHFVSRYYFRFNALFFLFPVSFFFNMIIYDFYLNRFVTLGITLSAMSTENFCRARRT